MPHDQRYERAEEYVEVVYKLLEGSWQEDSRIKDAISGKYSVAEKVRAIEHNGYVNALALGNIEMLTEHQKILQMHSYSSASSFDSADAIHPPSRCFVVSLSASPCNSTAQC